MEVINGVLYHAVGASSAALCYTPQKKVKGWAWQTYWLAQAFVCWLLLPVLIALLTIPQLSLVLQEAPRSAMQSSFFLGMAYGIGGTAFGVAIRYVGFSLTYAISVGISCVVGTILPPLVNGTLEEIFKRPGSAFISVGIVLGVMGIALCGLAGRKKEKDLDEKTGSHTKFSLAKGLPLCLLAGILSALYGFSIDQGQPIATVAAAHGAGHFQGNVIYLFSNSGAFLTTMIYCLYLHRRQGTFGEYRAVKEGDRLLPVNYAMAALTGLLWYGQFFFYGLGHVRMGNFKFSSWTIHMIMLVLFSSLLGLWMKEWKECKRSTRLVLLVALLVLVLAVLSLTYANYAAGE